MLYRPFVQYDTPEEYHQHFCQQYCNPDSLVTTFDSISVTFRPDDFYHAFFRGKPKAQFSQDRALRINWIREALSDSSAKLYLGWDKFGRRYTDRRRVCLVGGNYVTVIELFGGTRGRFVTAFIADPWIVPQIRQSPEW